MKFSVYINKRRAFTAVYIISNFSQKDIPVSNYQTHTIHCAKNAKGMYGNVSCLPSLKDMILFFYFIQVIKRSIVHLWFLASALLAKQSQFDTEKVNISNVSSISNNAMLPYEFCDELIPMRKLLEHQVCKNSIRTETVCHYF